MAVFMLNICKFNDCGVTFQSLTDLIQHIEDNHIDYDPHVIEEKQQEQPPCIPMSYVLRFFTDSASRKEMLQVRTSPSHNGGGVGGGGLASVPSLNGGGDDVVVAAPRRTTLPSPKLSSPPQPAAAPTTGLIAEDGNQSLGLTTNKTFHRRSLPTITPIVGQGDDEEFESESEDSNDSWSVQEEFSSEFILKYGSKRRAVSPSTLPDGTVIEKPFACPVPGCKKRYKNVNGIKYHSKNGHKNEGKVRKGFKCYCGKSYKTNGGLKKHTSLMHSGTTMTTIATQNGSPQVLQIPTLQPIRALTLKQVTGLNLPVKTLVVATKGTSAGSRTTTTTTTTTTSSNLGVLTPATSPNSPASSPGHQSTSSSSSLSSAAVVTLPAIPQLSPPTSA